MFTLDGIVWTPSYPLYLTFHFRDRRGAALLRFLCVNRSPIWYTLFFLEQFSYDLEMKTREQNRNNKRTEIERFDWFIEWIQTRAAVGWLANARVKKRDVQERSRNQPILPFDVILQHDWSIEQCLLHIRVFFGGKTKTPYTECKYGGSLGRPGSSWRKRG